MGMQIYDLIIKPLRDADAAQGMLFLKRLLGGPQAEWDRTHDKIDSLPLLWSALECDDDQLWRLKNIIGWTRDLDSITSRLTTDLLRRLIAVSATLWRDRGPEDTTLDVLRVLTGMRCRIWNWFDTRFLVEETGLGEEAEGHDPFLIDSPGVGAAEYQSNLRIVDQGDLDRQLVADVVRLMRAAGERIEISYLSFLDLFDVEGDSFQWQQVNGTSMQVTGGEMRLTSSAYERIVTSTPGSSAWTGTMTASRILSPPTYVNSNFGLVLHWIDPNNYRTFVANLASNQVTVAYVVAGVFNSVSISLTPLGITLRTNTHYMLRACLTPMPGYDQAQCYIDGNPVLVANIPGNSHGASGLVHNINCPLVATEFEVAPMPMDSDQIGIN